MPRLTGTITTIGQNLSGDITPKSGRLSGSVARPATIGDYNLLINKPQIESVELVGNKSLEEIGVYRTENAEIALLD